MSTNDDEQATAEATDPDELGDDPTDTLAYPPEEPLGIDDPTQDDRAVDSVAERAQREEPELGLEDLGGDLDPDDAAAIRLVAPNDVMADDEKDAVAIAVEQDASELSAEEAAIHPVE